MNDYKYFLKPTRLLTVPLLLNTLQNTLYIIENKKYSFDYSIMKKFI